jgi:hypothetical protein
VRIGVLPMEMLFVLICGERHFSFYDRRAMRFTRSGLIDAILQTMLAIVAALLAG